MKELVPGRVIGVCVHCSKRRWSGRVGRWKRGLCWRCYENKRIRKKYPMLPGSHPNQRGVVKAARKPCVPTTAMPGSEEKIEVLAGRVARGESLFHPRDLRLRRGPF